MQLNQILAFGLSTLLIGASAIPVSHDSRLGSLVSTLEARTSLLNSQSIEARDLTGSTKRVSTKAEEDAGNKAAVGVRDLETRETKKEKEERLMREAAKKNAASQRFPQPNDKWNSKTSAPHGQVKHKPGSGKSFEKRMKSHWYFPFTSFKATTQRNSE